VAGGEADREAPALRQEPPVKKSAKKTAPKKTAATTAVKKNVAKAAPKKAATRKKTADKAPS
jgi:hypothetical protein